MRFYAHIDTPWVLDTSDPNGATFYRSKVSQDFAADIHSTEDITGDSKYSSVPVSEQGGNYPKDSNVQADPPNRYGGSGDPDYMVVRAEIDAVDQAAADLIYATIDGGEFWVFYTETIDDTPP